MMSATRNKFSPEFRDRAVRMVEEHRGDYPSEWAAMSSIAAKVGCTTETLRRWCADFHAHLTKVQRLGFDERFQRIWEFYLAYCEAAFDMGNTNVVQYTLRKPG